MVAGVGSGVVRMIRRLGVGRVTNQKGRKETDGADSSSCRGPNAAQATKATEGAGEGWTDGRADDEREPVE